MALTDTAVRNAKAGAAPKSMADERGLSLLIQPSGGKWWRFRYRFDNKQKMLSVGIYPDVSLKQARERRDEARRLLAEGIDPGEHRKITKTMAANRTEDSFEAVAREWFAKFSPTWAETHASKIIRRLEVDIFPWLRFRDTRGRWKTWGMPMELLSGLGNEIRGELLAQGLELDPHNRNHLAAYLQTANTRKHMENALTTGWHGGVFVLPDAIIGGDGKVHFQSHIASTKEYSQAGTLEAWRTEVAAYCVGNPLLVFAVARDGRALADHLLQSVGKHHGHAGRAFLERLVADETDFGAALALLADLPHFTAEGGESQEKRAGKLFALVAVAGELATEYAVTGWPRGTALAAASEAFRLWREYRSKGNTEARQIVEKVLDFIDRHGDSRFSCFLDSTNSMTRDRAGWWRAVGDERQYLFSSGGLREALTGYDFKRGLDVLEQAGLLDLSRANRTEGRRTQIRVQGRNQGVYVINPGVRHES